MGWKLLCVGAVVVGDAEFLSAHNSDADTEGSPGTEGVLLACGFVDAAVEPLVVGAVGAGTLIYGDSGFETGDR